MKRILLLTDFSENALLAAQQVALCTEAWKTQRLLSTILTTVLPLSITNLLSLSMMR
jgi:hypothetical protein